MASSGRRSLIRPLNVLYLKLDRQLLTNEVTLIKNQLVPHHMDRADVERHDTASSIFHYLEQRGHISENNLELLVQLFRQIGRGRLAREVEDFMRAHSPGLPPRPASESSRQQREQRPHLEEQIPQETHHRPRSELQQTERGQSQSKRRLGKSKTPQEATGIGADILRHVPGKQSVLFVSSECSKDIKRVSMVTRLLAESLDGEGVDRYATTLEASDDKFSTDDGVGLTIAHALSSKVGVLRNQKPTVDWLTNYPNAIYDHLGSIENVALVVGHHLPGDEQLHQAGFAIHENMAESKFFLFNHDIPESLEGTSDLDVARRADAIFSIGPAVYSHFQNHYQILPEAKDHVCYYPPLSAAFMDLTLAPPNAGLQKILTFCEVDSKESFSKYDEIAVAMGNVAEALHKTRLPVPIWDVMVSAAEGVATDFKEHLQKTSKATHHQIYVGTKLTVEELRKKIQQSTVLVAPEKRDPFSFPAFLAMQAGLPVVMARRSGIGEFIAKVCPLHCDACFVEAGVQEGGIGSADKWEEKITETLRKRELSFKKAAKIKEALADDHHIATSKTVFLSHCRRALGRGEFKPGADDIHLGSSVIAGGRISTSDVEGSDDEIDFRSVVWRHKLEKLLAMTEDPHLRQIGNIKICMTDEFLVDRGSNFTEVYLGIDLKEKVEVAVKRIDTQGISIKNEVEVMKTLVDLSTNVVNFYDCIESSSSADRCQYIVMELCEKTLEDYVEEQRSHGGNCDDVNKNLITDVLCGLRTLHGRKIVHRDLKPRNVLIDYLGRAKMSDFGISRQIKDATRIHTRRTATAGTECWESYETLAPKFGGETQAEYSDKSDIQVAGYLIFYILTGGSHPFGNVNTPLAVAFNIKDDNPVNINMLQDPAARRLVERMIKRDRRERPTIEEVLRLFRDDQTSLLPVGPAAAQR